jgi:hypothetical protein
LLARSVKFAGVVDTVPDVNAILVISVLAPDAAAPRDVLAPDAVVAFVPPLATGKVPVTPVVKGKPVAFVKVAADGVPKLGVVKVGLVARTTLPDPVVASSPTVPALSYKTRPVVPPVIVVVLIVTPLLPAEAAIVIEPAPFVMVTLEPAVKVVRVNPVPFPISICPLVGAVVNPVPPFAIGRVPVTPVVNGNPVALVNVTEVGVPRTGVTSVGLVERTLEPDPVLVVTPVPPLATARVPDIVNVPEDVIGPPEKVMPVVPPDALTLVTVPADVAAIDTPPDVFVILMPLPAVNVDNV